MGRGRGGDDRQRFPDVGDGHVDQVTALNATNAFSVVLTREAPGKQLLATLVSTGGCFG